MWRRSGYPKLHLNAGRPERGEELSDDLRGESDGSPPIDTTMDGREVRNVFWSIEGNYIYRHHVEPRVQLYVPKEETFPTPMRYSDVVGRIRPWTWLQQSRMDDQWNIDGDRNLSDPWSGFTQFTKTNEKHPG